MQSLAQLAQDLHQILRDKANQLALVVSFAGEPSPNDIELLSHTTLEPERTEANTRQSPLSTKPQPGKAKNIDLPANFGCQLCTMRLYPVKKFFRSGKVPVLVLYHNGHLFPSRKEPMKIPMDRSEKFIFGSEEKDKFFTRMLSKLEYDLKDFYYQEFPACHFSADRSTETDWQQRTKNCTTHLEATLQKYNIHKIILCGNAAVTLLGTGQAQEAARRAHIFPLKVGLWNLDCIVLRSPGALLTLEAQRKKASNPQKHTKVLQQEREIKAQMLKGLGNLLASLQKT